MRHWIWYSFGWSFFDIVHMLFKHHLVNNFKILRKKLEETMTMLNMEMFVLYRHKYSYCRKQLPFDLSHAFAVFIIEKKWHLIVSVLSIARCGTLSLDSLVFSSYWILSRVIDVQRQGFSLIGQTLSKLQPSELRRISCFPPALFGVLWTSDLY